MVELTKSDESERIRRTTIRVNLMRKEDQSYPIIIENGILNRIPQDLKERNLGERFAIITDTNVSARYGGALEYWIENAGFMVGRYVFSEGEQQKRLRICEDLVGGMSSDGFGRDTTVIALGGGVVGDMAGFIAASFNRGVPLIQIPTTLIAQADSSIGGKTGVDTEYGKNLFGAFKQPNIVYIDPLTLRTLAPIDYFSGLAETVKHGVIQDSNFFGYLEQNTAKILRMGDDALLNLAETNCRIKGNVVEADPNEKGIRRILNLGHTIGHAVETLSDYNLPHGHCVAIGMLSALRIAKETTGFPQEDLERVERLLKEFNLPTKIPSEITNDGILKLTTLDKKAAKGQARYCLPVKIGEMADFGGQYVTYVDEPLVRQALDESRQ